MEDAVAAVPAADAAVVPTQLAAEQAGADLNAPKALLAAEEDGEVEAEHGDEGHGLASKLVERCVFGCVSFTHAFYWAIFFGFIVFCLVISGVVYAGTDGLKTLLSSDTGNENVVSTSIQSHRNDAFVEAKKLVAANVDVVPTRSDSDSLGATSFFYDWADGRADSIFTAANIQTMCEVENLLVGHVNYTQYCKLPTVQSATVEAECLPQYLSAPARFYHTIDLSKHSTCGLLPAADVTALAATMETAVADRTSAGEMYKFFMANDIATARKSKRARSFLVMGSPLKGFARPTEERRKQTDLKMPFWYSVNDAILKHFHMKPPIGPDSWTGPPVYPSSLRIPMIGKLIFYDRNFYYFVQPETGPLAVKFFNVYTFILEFARMVWSDLAWVLVMITFVGAYMMFHTGSFFLAQLGMMQILFSFPLSYFVYRFVFQVQYFSAFNILIVFIVLGIGADDLFVLVDAYKQSEAAVQARAKREASDRARQKERSGATRAAAARITAMERFRAMWEPDAMMESKNDVLKQRMSYAYDRAMKSIFNTSFTTAFAFLANLASPLMPTQAFGIWAAIVIVMNYIIDITWTPAGIIIYHKWFQCLPFCGCCFCCSWPKAIACCPTTPPMLTLMNCCGKCLCSTFPSYRCAAIEGSEEPIAKTSASCCQQPDDSCPGEIGSCPEEPFTWCASQRDGDSGDVASELAALEAGETGEPSASGDDEDRVVDVTENPASLAARSARIASVDESSAANGTAAAAQSMSPVQLAFAKVYLPLILNPWICTPKAASSAAAAAEDPEGAVVLTTPREAEAPTAEAAAAPTKSKIPCPPKYLKIVSVICVVVLGTYAAVATSYALQLSTPVDDERWFPKGHMLDTIFSEARDNYLEASNDRYVSVNLVHGVKSIDRTKNPSGKSFDSWNPSDNRGTVEMDGGFSLATRSAQDWVIGTCDAVEQAPCTNNGCTGGRLVVAATTKCVLRDLRTWLQESHTKNGVGVDSEGNGYATTAAVAGVVQSGWVPGELPLGDTEIAQSLTLYYAKNRTAAREGLAGVKDDKIIWLNVHVTSTLEVFSIMNKNQGAHDAFEAFQLSRTGSAAPGGLNSMFHCARTWNRLVTQKAYVEGMYASLTLCFPVTFGVLLFATRNILLASYGILSIGCIVMCVLGWCKLVMGWYLGTAETIAAVMIVGLSVDYVVHLGHMFLESPLGSRSREKRVAFSSVAMGVTVVGGAGTTFGAGVIMFACQITFFEKFAVLIPLTIFFSLSYALFFFMPLCAILGPSGKCGDVLFPLEKLFALALARIKKSEVGAGEISKRCCVRFLTDAAGLTIDGEETYTSALLAAGDGAVREAAAAEHGAGIELASREGAQAPSKETAGGRSDALLRASGGTRIV